MNGMVRRGRLKDGLDDEKGADKRWMAMVE